MPFDNHTTDPFPHTRGHTTPEGILNLSIPVGLADLDVSVNLQIKRVQPVGDVDENPHSGRGASRGGKIAGFPCRNSQVYPSRFRY